MRIRAQNKGDRWIPSGDGAQITGRALAEESATRPSPASNFPRSGHGKPFLSLSFYTSKIECFLTCFSWGPFLQINLMGQS